MNRREFLKRLVVSAAGFYVPLKVGWFVSRDKLEDDLLSGLVTDHSVHDWVLDDLVGDGERPAKWPQITEPTIWPML